MGLGQSRYGDLEHGNGASAPLRVWIALGIAIDRPLAVAFSRSLLDDPRDTGHLAAREHVLALARAAGVQGTFELPNRPANPTRFADVGLRDDVGHAIVLVEVANRLDDFGAGVRDFHRKIGALDRFERSHDLDFGMPILEPCRGRRHCGRRRDWETLAHEGDNRKRKDCREQNGRQQNNHGQPQP